MHIFLIIIGIIFILMLFISLYFFNLAFVRRNISELEDLNSPANDFLDEYRPLIRNGMDFIKNHPKEMLYIKSFDGLRLAAKHFNVGSDKTVMLFHGYRSCADRDFSCAVKMYCEAGYNVLLADQRAHGASKGRLITFGVKEHKDALAWVDYYVKAFPDNKAIFLSGMSMGATTVLLTADKKLPENVKGIIADCGFTSPTKIITLVAKRALHINAAPLLPIMNLYCRIFGGFSLYGISTVNSLRATKLPVLFIHGKKDDFVPPEMSEEGYNNSSGEKEILLVEGADHGLSFLIDSKGVSAALMKFLKKYS